MVLFAQCTKPIYLCIHVCIMGDYVNILRSYKAKMDELGLVDCFHKILLGIAGRGDHQSIVDIFAPMPVDVIDSSDDVAVYERLTLHRLYERSLLEDFHVLYIHTKGVTHPSTDIRVYVWRNKMLFFMMQYIPLILHQLDHQNADVVGIDYISGRLWPAHYSGNFWWTTSSHLRTLPVPIGGAYLDPEMWICRNRRGKYMQIYHTPGFTTAGYYMSVTERNHRAIIREYSSNRLEKSLLNPPKLDVYIEDMLESTGMHMYGTSPVWTTIDDGMVRSMLRTGKVFVRDLLSRVTGDTAPGTIKFWVFQRNGRLCCYIDSQELQIYSRHAVVLPLRDLPSQSIYGTSTNFITVHPHNIQPGVHKVGNELFEGGRDPHYGQVKTWRLDYHDDLMELVEGQEIVILA